MKIKIIKIHVFAFFALCLSAHDIKLDHVDLLKQRIIDVHQERLAIIRGVSEPLLQELVQNLEAIAAIKNGAGIFDICKEQQKILRALQSASITGKTDTRDINHFKLLAQKKASLELETNKRILPLQQKVHAITQKILKSLSVDQKQLLKDKGGDLIALRSQLRGIQPCALADDQEGLLDLLFM